MEKLINMIKITERNSELPATNLETLGTYFLVLHPRDKGMNNAITRRKLISYIGITNSPVSSKNT